MISSMIMALALIGAPADETAFVDVSVLPMDGERVLEHQTVVVRRGVIAAIGPAARVRVRRGARVVQGGGRYLIPGLADMHAHIDNPEDFPTMLAAGVTTTLNMGGASQDYLTRVVPDIRAGRAVGPWPLTAFKIDGPGDEGGTAFVPANEEEAREGVRRARREGYQYVKVYSRLQAELFEAVMDEARRQRMPVIGHVVRSVGLAHSLERGQVMIAHGEEYLTVFDNAPDAARIPELVRMSVESGVTVTANVAGINLIAEQWGQRDQVNVYLQRPEALEMREALREKWRRASYGRLSGTYTAEAEFVSQLTAALYQAGVPIIVGTDAPDIPGGPPGAAVIDEIDALRGLGFTPYNALAAATSMPGDFVARTAPRERRFGRVARGYRADLVLLAANPLTTPETLRAPVGVMSRGHWMPAAPR